MLGDHQSAVTVAADWSANSRNNNNDSHSNNTSARVTRSLSYGHRTLSTPLALLPHELSPAPAAATATTGVTDRRGGGERRGEMPLMINSSSRLPSLRGGITRPRAATTTNTTTATTNTNTNATTINTVVDADTNLLTMHAMSDHRPNNDPRSPFPRRSIRRSNSNNSNFNNSNYNSSRSSVSRVSVSLKEDSSSSLLL
jgi:hypothetical protein